MLSGGCWHETFDPAQLFDEEALAHVLSILVFFVLVLQSLKDTQSTCIVISSCLLTISRQHWSISASLFINFSVLSFSSFYRNKSRKEVITYTVSLTSLLASRSATALATSSSSLLTFCRYNSLLLVIKVNNLFIDAFYMFCNPFLVALKLPIYNVWANGSIASWILLIIILQLLCIVDNTHLRISFSFSLRILVMFCTTESAVHFSHFVLLTFLAFANSLHSDSCILSCSARILAKFLLLAIKSLSSWQRTIFFTSACRCFSFSLSCHCSISLSIAACSSSCCSLSLLFIAAFSDILNYSYSNVCNN